MINLIKKWFKESKHKKHLLKSNNILPPEDEIRMCWLYRPASYGLYWVNSEIYELAPRCFDCAEWQAEDDVRVVATDKTCLNCSYCGLSPDWKFYENL